MTGFIVTLDTGKFVFEAHGETEEQANEAMGKALQIHANQCGLDADWWQDYEFNTHEFKPGVAWRDYAELVK